MNNTMSLNIEKPSVSVIVTTYNRLNLLPETLFSILSQTFNDFELIIVDNMSMDGTSEYVASLTDPRIRYFRNPNHGIIAVNRNYGIRQAIGRYIAFCDDDDLWMLDKLSKQVALLETTPKLALCYTNAESFVGKKILSARMISRVVHQHHFWQLLRGNFIPNSSVLIRSNVFQKVGLLSESPDLREDYEMCLRIAHKHEIAGIDEPLIRYRVHVGNVAGNRVSETLRAIRTVKSVIRLLCIPWYIAIPNVAFQYLKCFFYKFTSR